MAKTLSLFLTDGSPEGIKIIELSGWIGKAVMIPRAQLQEAKKRAELEKPSIYFLFGEDNEGFPMAYIGETTNLLNRMASHGAGKDFWTHLYAFVTKDNTLSSTEIKYLEAKCIEMAFGANRFLLDNKKGQIPSDLSESKIAELEEFLGNINLILSTLGCPLLNKIEQEKTASKQYHCTGPNADAIGYYRPDGFLVLSGSKARIEPSPTAGSWITNMQQKLLAKKVLTPLDSLSYAFTSDYLFASPSAASALVLSRRSNGWNDWKDENKVSLHENERKVLNKDFS